MKTLALFGCSLVLLTSPLCAQTAPSPTPPSDSTPAAGHPHHPDFLAQLQLTDAQKAQIKQIAQSGDTKEQKHQAIKALLTESQRAQLKQLRQAWKAQHEQPTTS